MFRVFALGLILAAFSVIPQSAAANQVPLDENGFTAYVAKAFQDTHPGFSITVAGPLHLKVQRGGDVWSSYLFTLYSFCLRNPDTCEPHVVIHAEQMAEAHKDADAHIEASALRIMVRQTAYVDQIAANLKGRGDPVVEPIAGDLWIVAVIDRPSTVGILGPKDLDALHLSADEALARAKENTKAAIARRIPSLDSGSDDFEVLWGDVYQASLFAFPEIWAPLAKAYGDRLIVAVPGSDVMLFTRDAGNDSVAALAKMAAATMKGEYRPFSSVVYRWTDKGWIEASR
ncbi:MAG: hypothetical protein ACLPID_20895 [Beijerinckiaceae bacterium]